MRPTAVATAARASATAALTVRPATVAPTVRPTRAATAARASLMVGPTAGPTAAAGGDGGADGGAADGGDAGADPRRRRGRQRLTGESDPAAGGAALERCVACGSDRFAADHWGRAPLLTRAAELRPRRSTTCSTPPPSTSWCLGAGLRTPFLRMAKDGAVLPTGRFTRGGGAGAGITDQAADDKVLAMLADGATLVLQALHRTWPPLVDFAAALSAELGHPVQINAYITPPQNQGFAPHYDVHDVFVLQVRGPQALDHPRAGGRDPLADQPWEGYRDAGGGAGGRVEPLIDTVLEPGDALYLPRGTIHAAQALGETSIHLTVGVHPLTRYQPGARSCSTLAQGDARAAGLAADGRRPGRPGGARRAPGRHRGRRCAS